MSGFEPILIGSALGAATNRRNPLSGALLGGVLGGVGGAAYGAMNPAATATMTGASATPIGVATPGMALNSGAAFNAATPMATATMPATFATGGTTGLIPSMTAPVSMMDRLGAVGQFAKENPYAVGIGLQSANSLLATQPPPTMAPPPGLMRGQQFQVEQPQYAMFQPKPISLI